MGGDVFDASGRVGLDGCALSLRDRVNEVHLGYVLRPRDVPPAERLIAEVPRGHPLRVAQDHRNLRPWDGFGLNVNAVEDDNNMRHGSRITHMRDRIQLAKRVFHAGPDLHRGSVQPDTESMLLGGALDTSAIKHRNPLVERDFDRFDPVLTCDGPPAHDPVEAWVRGGAASRDIARSTGFLKGLGYKWDGRAWHREKAKA